MVPLLVGDFAPRDLVPGLLQKLERFRTQRLLHTEQGVSLFTQGQAKASGHGCRPGTPRYAGLKMRSPGPATIFPAHSIVPHPPPGRQPEGHDARWHTF